MAMCDGNIRPGFMGLVSIGNNVLLAESASIAPQQEVVTPDVMLGMPDVCAYYDGPLIWQGNVSGFLSSTAFNLIWPIVFNRSGGCELLNPEQVRVSLCGEGLNMTGFINQFTVSVSAGDAVKFSMDVIGATGGETSGSAGSFSCGVNGTELATWRTANISYDGIAIGGGGTHDPCLQSFELTVNNNIEPIYCIGLNEPGPACFLPQRRTITGSLTVYGVNFTPQIQTGTLGIFGKIIKGRFAPLQPSLSTGVPTSTVAFSGLGVQDQA